jgi:glyoxylase-like metal-dependent hydrolase (beta-lactamase superfamily II)
MTKKKHQPITVTSNFHQLGTPSFPVYLSMGEEGMIIEGGTGPTFNIIVEQINALGIDPRRIKYIVLTHTHSDHIGAVPRLKIIWPHLKVLASSEAARALENKGMLKDFLWVDGNVAKLMKEKGEIAELPHALKNHDFWVDTIVDEGDKVNLGSGIEWTVYKAPGHSACHIALYEKKEDTLIIGDTTGFYVPEKDVFWPNYFDSLESYLSSIKKLSTLDAKRVALSHNCVIAGEVGKHFEKALVATESYHTELMERIKAGEDAEKVALEKAVWVNSLTDIQPFEVMHNLSRLLIKRSRAYAGKHGQFTLGKEEEGWERGK